MKKVLREKLGRDGVFITSISVRSRVWKGIKKFSTIYRELSRGSRAPPDNAENAATREPAGRKNSPRNFLTFAAQMYNSLSRNSAFWKRPRTRYAACSTHLRDRMAAANERLRRAIECDIHGETEFRKSSRTANARANCVNVRSCFSERGAWHASVTRFD